MLKTLPATSLEQSELRTQQIDWRGSSSRSWPLRPGRTRQRPKIRLLDPALGPAAKSEPGTFADARDPCQGGLGPFPRRPGRAARGREQPGAGNDRDSQRQRRQQIAAAQSEALKYCRLAIDLRTAGACSGD